MASVVMITGWDEDTVRGTPLSVIRALMRLARKMNQSQGPPMGGTPARRR